MHTCIRIYNDGSQVVEQREESEVESWLEYNTKHRFGCALFVDGECLQKGCYISEERCQQIKENLMKDKSVIGTADDTCCECHKPIKAWRSTTIGNVCLICFNPKKHQISEVVPTLNEDRSRRYGIRKGDIVTCKKDVTQQFPGNAEVTDISSPDNNRVTVAIDFGFRTKNKEVVAELLQIVTKIEDREDR